MRGEFGAVMGALLGFAAIVLMAIWPGSARPHDFYTGTFNRAGESCCGLNDCAPIPNSEVRLTPLGYAVRFNDGEVVIPYGHELQSPDGRFHKCVWGGTVKCLFVPPLGA